MIDIRTILLPVLLKPEDTQGRAVVVFDVLRATTSITTAIENGAKEIRVFGSIEAARGAASECIHPKLLAGEQQCKAPAGFDLGNSPASFTQEMVKDKTIFLSTTNGTVALTATTRASRLFVACLRNASAVGRVLRQLDLPVLLLCAGTEGNFSLEDFLGCGAVLNAIDQTPGLYCADDASVLARRVFLDATAKNELEHLISSTKAAENIRRAFGRNATDIGFCAMLDQSECIPECDPMILSVGRFRGL